MPNEQELIQLKRGNAKLGFAVMFKFFQYEARFPHTKSEIPKTVVDYIAKQLDVNSDTFSEYDGPDVLLLNLNIPKKKSTIQFLWMIAFSK
jgi:hypothetical protein